MKKRKVQYTIYGENEAILKHGECFARYDEYEMQDICDHASIHIEDVWSLATTEAQPADVLPQRSEGQNYGVVRRI